MHEEKTISENIDFSNLEMDEKASKNLKGNKFENIDTYLSEVNQADELTKAIETGIIFLIDQVATVISETFFINSLNLSTN